MTISMFGLTEQGKEYKAAESGLIAFNEKNRSIQEADLSVADTKSERQAFVCFQLFTSK